MYFINCGMICEERRQLVRMLRNA